MSYVAIICNICLISICMLIAFTIIKSTKEETEVNENQINEDQNHIPKYSYNVLMENLDNIINKELYFTRVLKFDLMKVKIIDFEKNLYDISTSIANSINDDFIKDLCYYHKKEWIFEYIVRQVKIFLFDYIKKNNV